MSDYKNKILDLAARLETVSKTGAGLKKSTKFLSRKRLLTEKIKCLGKNMLFRRKAQVPDKERDSLNIRLVEKIRKETMSGIFYHQLVQG